jgi:hypothetical protein
MYLARAHTVVARASEGAARDEALGRAFALGGRGDDDATLAAPTLARAEIAIAKHDAAAARDLTRRALAMAEASGEAQDLAVALALRADAELEAGARAEAAQLASRALVLLPMCGRRERVVVRFAAARMTAEDELPLALSLARAAASEAKDPEPIQAWIRAHLR